MSIHYNGQNIKEIYYNGQKISEVYYNGEKVLGDNNILFEADVTFSRTYTLPTTYPRGSIIEWTTNSQISQMDYFQIYNESTQESQHITLGVVTTANIAFNALWNFNVWEELPSRTYHIKITKGV